MGQLTGLFFMVFILMAGGYILAVLGQLVPVSLITGMSEEWIAFWAVLVCMTGIRGGMPGRGRMAQISGGVLLGGMILMMILCIPQGKAEYLQDMAAAWKFSGQEIFDGFYGTICAFSAVGLLPFLLGNVEKYASAGKTVLAGILTLAWNPYGNGCAPSCCVWDMAGLFRRDIRCCPVAGRSRPAGKCAGQI